MRRAGWPAQRRRRPHECKSTGGTLDTKILKYITSVLFGTSMSAESAGEADSQPEPGQHACLDCLVVEVVFPDCGRLLMSNGQLHSQGRLIGQALAGDLFRSPGGWGARLLAGSRAQELTMESGWGQQSAAEDTMFFYGAGWGVEVEPPCVSAETKTDKRDLNHNSRSQSENEHRINVTVPSDMGIGDDTIRRLNEACLDEGDIITDVPPGGLDVVSSWDDGNKQQPTVGKHKARGKLLLQVTDKGDSFCEVHAHGNVDGLLSSMARARIGALGIHHLGEKKARSCLVTQDGARRLSSHRTRRMLHGEAIETSVHTPDFGMDWVPSLVCSHPLPAMQEFTSRRRAAQWPRRHTLLQLAKLPGILTCMGKCGSPRSNVEFRYSWCMHEILLAADMPPWVKQGYCAFKFTVQNFMHRYLNGKQGQPKDTSIFASYYLKNVLWWELEDTDIWQKHCPYNVLLLLLNRLSTHLQPPREGPCILPHYFQPSCNLLDTTSGPQVERCRAAVRDILADPLAALVAAPDQPEEIFGRGDTLTKIVAWVGKTLKVRTGGEGDYFLESVRALKSAEGSHSYATRLSDVGDVLGRVHRRRQARDAEQRQRDALHSKVPGRAPLRHPVEMLRRMSSRPRAPCMSQTVEVLSSLSLI